MKNGSTQATAPLQSSRRQSWKPVEAMRWMVAACVTLVATAAFVAAIIYAPSSIRTNNTECLRQIANDEHTSLEAFFLNPAEQDAFVQAVTACTR